MSSKINQDKPPGPKGIAMLIVIAITGIVALLIGLMMAQYFSRRSAIRVAILDAQNFYTAESGIKLAFYYLTQDETKGIQWRTGDLFNDNPVEEYVFHGREDKVILSVRDDCGLLRVRSVAKSHSEKIITVTCAANIPSSMKTNLHLVSSKPLILAAGSHVSGRIKINQEPVIQGGGIDGIIETMASLSTPPVLTQSFGTSIRYYRILLSRPDSFQAELFSPQVFSIQKPFPARRMFINDMVLIENRDVNSLWDTPSGLLIASTAEVQISGKTRIKDATILAIGPVKVMDQAILKSVRIYSESSIELKEQSIFSGTLIAPEIRISERGQVTNSTLMYCGPPLRHGKITLETELPVSCTIFNLCGGKDSQLFIADRTRVTGFIYSLAPITLRGEVSGYVYCHGFLEAPITQDTTNSNIISGVIKPAQSANPFTLPVVFQEIDDLRILEWQEY